MKALTLRPRLRLPHLGIGPQVVVVLLVLALLGAMAIEPTRQLLEQRERISGMAADVAEIERSNSHLSKKIERLQDPDFLEQRAREQIGLVRPGEVAIVVMPPSKKAHDREPKRNRAQKEKPPLPSGFIEGFLNFVGLL